MDSSEVKQRKINPIEKANLLSLFTFGYTVGLFRKGFKKDLEEHDIYEVVKSCRSKKLGDLTEKQWTKSTSILKLLFHRFGLQYLMISVIHIAWTEINSILSPLGISRLIAYFTPNQTKITTEQAYQYAAVVIFLKVGGFLVWSNLHVFQTVVAMKIHASLKSLLYRKALKLSPCSTSGTNLGNLITLITKDINSVEHNLWLLKDFTVFFIQFFTISYLLYDKMGNPAFIGLGMMFAAVPIQVFLSSKQKNLRLKVQEYSDERLQKMQETLSAIKIIKMYTWEQFFYGRISESRKNEIRKLVNVIFVNTINTTIGLFVAKGTFLILILSYIWLGYTTNTEMIFYVLSLFHQLNMQFGISLPINFSKTAQLYASLQRLNKVLQAEELMKRNEGLSKEKPSISLKDVGIMLGNKDVLDSISFNIANSGLTVITGPVGSGKSSLLKAILRDYSPLSKGHLEVHGNISYASQEPWLFPSTIRQNILFGEEYDRIRYDEVVRVCALKYDFAIFDDGDSTIVADKGMNLSKGQQARINLARAVYRETNIYLLDDSLTALDNHVQEFIFRECIMGFLTGKICFLISQNHRHIEKADKVIVLNEGKLLYFGEPKNIRQEAVDDFTAKMNEENQTKDKEVSQDGKNEIALVETEQQQFKRNVFSEEKKRGKVGIDIYKKYFQFGGGFIVFSFIILLYVVSQLCDSSSEKLLSRWVDLQQKVLDLEKNSIYNESVYQNAISEKENAFNMYGILTLLRCIMGLVQFYALLRFCQNASVNLHNSMTIGVIGATMTFFDTHFIGNILNRFSYDLNNVDEHIPFLFPGLGRTLFGAGGSIILITTVNWFFLIPAFVFLIMMLVMRWLFIPTARSLKRLEASTRSPLVGHINSSLEGLTTIRAFKAEQILKDEFDKHQDLYTSAFMTLRISMYGFGFFMDFFNCLFTIVIVARFLFFERNSTAGDVGLALTQVFQLTSYVEWAIRMWADLENSMTSVERAVEYTALKQESRTGHKISNWPSKGSIKFKNINLCYEGSKTSVLKGISFDVKPREKIGIVGRTGAGKSSIITVLYRLYDFEGIIEIDGVDTKSISLEFLRKNIAIIPQDPVLFTGTIRQNIDPENKYTDALIWEVIHKVGIKDMVPTLNTMVVEGGAKYSSGQKQLICLARSAIGKCTILVLDEATANMDAETDRMLHAVISELFWDCTILSIAHRLHSILNCDKVLVLDNGKIVEYDNPIFLMNKEESLFHTMCKDFKMD